MRISSSVRFELVENPSRLRSRQARTPLEANGWGWAQHLCASAPLREQILLPVRRADGAKTSFVGLANLVGRTVEIGTNWPT